LTPRPRRTIDGESFLLLMMMLHPRRPTHFRTHLHGPPSVP
jgi:hypothetical protein